MGKESETVDAEVWVSEGVWMGIVGSDGKYVGDGWGREEGIFLYLESKGASEGENLLGAEEPKGTGSFWDDDESPIFIVFFFDFLSEGSLILFMKFGGCSGIQSTENSDMSIPWDARSWR